eukprot:9472375-Pyramimonas_sp.AAC.1
MEAYLQPLSTAGESVTEAPRCAGYCDILLNKYVAMDINGECALKAARQESEDTEKALREMRDYKTAKNTGGQQSAHLMERYFADNWSDDMQLFNARGRGAGWGETWSGACPRGPASPD